MSSTVSILLPPLALRLLDAASGNMPQAGPLSRAVSSTGGASFRCRIHPVGPDARLYDAPVLFELCLYLYEHPGDCMRRKVCRHLRFHKLICSGVLMVL